MTTMKYHQILALKVLIILIVQILQPCLSIADDAVLSQHQKNSILHEALKQVIPDHLEASKEGITKKMIKQDSFKNEEMMLNERMTIKVDGLLLNEVIVMIARQLNLNPVINASVPEKPVSYMFQDMPIGNILDTMLFPYGFGFLVKDGDLIVLDKQTRIFRVMLPPVNQDFQDTTSNESYVQNATGQNDNQNKGSSSNQQIKVGAKVVVTNSASNLSFWNDVSENIKSMLSSQGHFSLNRSAGTVMVADSPSKLKQVGSYFDDLNKRITQQIEVDVKVVEVNLLKDNRMGVDWMALAGNLKKLNNIVLASNVASGNFTGGSVFSLTGQTYGQKGGIEAVIEALSKQGHVNIVSQPKILMLNNQVSVIQVGSTQTYVDHSSVQTTQNGSTITAVSTSQVQEGVTMRLLGNIVGSDIYLSVTPVVTTIDGIRTINTGNTTIEAPQTTTKSLNTIVKLRQGATVAIGGLITTTHQKNKEGIPVLSNLPVIGKLFSYNQDKYKRSELIIFITPKKV